jgi:ligand-binding sensor domain-containing protein
MPHPLPLSLLALLLTGGPASDEVPPPAAPPDQAQLPLMTSWTTWTAADGLPSDKVFCVLADGEDVWAGTDKGLARLHEGRWEVYDREDGLVHPAVTALALAPTTGDLWIGTMGGLSRWSAGRFDRYDQLGSGLINDVIYAVEVIEGEVWSATAAGVSVYHPEQDRWELYDHTNTVMHEPWCYALTQSPGTAWVAVWGGGVVEHDRAAGTWKAYRDPDHEMEIDLFRDDGLVHDVISSVSWSEGVLWAGTYFGLSRYDGLQWRSWLDHDSPLPSNFINVVRASGRWAWIGTDDGLAAFDGATWLVYRRDEDGPGCSVLITDPDGRTRTLSLPAAPAHRYVLWVHPQGDRVWVATSAGLSLGEAGPVPQAPEDP